MAATLLQPGVASAQSLDLTNGIHIYPALTNTVVTMSGRSELRLTASAAVLSGCLVNLNSSDAWVVLPGIKPSAALSYLSQLRVNGAVAVADSNMRVVQYGMGAVVIPHGPALQPLQVFSGPHFTGPSMLLSQYTAYSGVSLGPMNETISSLKLKRGYMATVAENENGTGASECYVAQDGDLEISLLPLELDNKTRFVRVFPWRWVSKKGVAGNIWQNLNVGWYYNWNLNQNSTRDLEYVAIRQTQWWPGLNQDWRARGINHLLGFNEPDHPDQANMTVSQAISTWPTLLATGLRVGAPAVTDGGASWLYSFIDAADAAGLRVDYVPVHYYRCYGNPDNPDGTATQFYNFLKGIYDRVKRPLWVTEWNNGANWTSCSDPTFAQQQAAVAKMIEMLDNTPFVERYAIYNWVEDVRRVQWDDGSLTAAGVTYRDKVSPISYLQALPNHGTRGVAQLRFEGTTLDTSGFGNNALAVGAPAYVAGRVGQALQFDGTSDYLQLPPNVASGSGFTFAAWIHWDGGGNWQRVFDFGNDTSQYMFLTARSGSGTLRFAMRNAGVDQSVETAGLVAGEWRHVAITLSGNTARIYVNGSQAAVTTSFSILPSSFKPHKNYLGESQYAADPLFNGRMDEVLITDYALTAAQISALATNLPPQFTSPILLRPDGQGGVPYSGTIAGTATDPNPADALTYSKAHGPAWLNVAANGSLSGTPGAGDAGTNTFTVRVVDPVGASAFAVLTIYVPSTLSNGNWIVDGSGTWSVSNFWSGGIIANGPGLTADFSTINISAERTITLDLSRSIGTLKFGDTSGNQAWRLNSSPGAVLTLSTPGATQPLAVVTNVATIAANLAGTNGLVKNGPGTLVLSGNNSLSGTLNVDSGNTSWHEGSVRIASPTALANVPLIQIRNNNNGTSTLELDGTAGPLIVASRLAVSCRHLSAPTIRNLGGTNTLSGFIGLETGGSLFNIQSDAPGLLVLTGVNQYVGSLVGARTYAFTGTGDHLVSGPIRNSTNGSVVSVSKTGPGTLTLDGVHGYTGSTTVNGGTLLVKGVLATTSLTLGSTAALGGSGTVAGPVTVNLNATLSPGLEPAGSPIASFASLAFNNNLILQPGSVTRMEIAKTPFTNDQLQVTGNLSLGGRLELVSASGRLESGDAFTLFQAASVTSAFESLTLPNLEPGLAWDTASLTNGIVRVVRSVASDPTNLTAVLTGQTLTVSWPQTHLGWRLQVQTNSLHTNWVTVPGTEALDHLSLPIDAAPPGLYFRLSRE